MKKSTDKQKKARARNWNKRLLIKTIRTFETMANVKYLNIGLTPYEQSAISNITSQISKLLKNWKRSI